MKVGAYFISTELDSTVFVSMGTSTCKYVIGVKKYDPEYILKTYDILFNTDQDFKRIMLHSGSMWKNFGYTYKYRIVRKEEFEKEANSIKGIPNGLKQFVIDDKELLKNSYIYNFPDMTMPQFIDDLIDVGFEMFSIFPKKACLYIDKQGIIRAYDRVPENTTKLKIDYQNTEFKFFENKQERQSIIMQSKIKITDIKFPVIIYDLDEEKKNKVMNALEVVWLSGKNISEENMGTHDAIYINRNADVERAVIGYYNQESKYDDILKISYNNIIWKNEYDFSRNTPVLNKKLHYTEIKKPEDKEEYAITRHSHKYGKSVIEALLNNNIKFMSGHAYDYIQELDRFKRCENPSKFVIPDEEVLDFKVNHNRKSFTLPEEE
jgi:hypothetical protein